MRIRPDSDSAGRNAAAVPGLLFAVLVAMAGMGTAGCGHETGIVVEVSRGDLTTNPDTLRFYVGVSVDDLTLDLPGCGKGARFVEGADTGERVIAVADRDLERAPYRLLLEPGAELTLEEPVMVAVAALAGEEVLGLAAIDGPARFVDGQVLEWRVALAKLATSEDEVTGSGCVCARSAAAIIAPVGDIDCDGDADDIDCNSDSASVGPSKPEICANQIDDNCNEMIDEEVDNDRDGFTNCEDCNDESEHVYPGAPELCDGFDNNCDEADGRYPEYVECYARDSGECYLGKRQCNDDDPLAGGWVDDCLPWSTDPGYRGSDKLCATFEECIASVPYEEGMACANDATFADMSCQAFIYDNGQGAYQPCPEGGYLLQSPADLGSVCRWTLMGDVEQDQYKAYLTDLERTEEGAVVNACSAQLSVREVYAQPPEPPAPDTFYLWSEVEGNAALHWRLSVTAQILDSVELCPQQSIACTEPAGFTSVGAVR